MAKRKVFCNHCLNGFHISFPNGNSLSTIWGGGSYTENHDVSLMSGDKLIELGSDTVEIMPHSKNNKLINQIFKHFSQAGDDSVIGWVKLEDWIWVVNQLAKRE